MKRAIFLATATILAMLILAPMALAQETTLGAIDAMPAPSRFRRVVVLPSFCLRPRCYSGRAS